MLELPGSSNIACKSSVEARTCQDICQITKPNYHDRPIYHKKPSYHKKPNYYEKPSYPKKPSYHKKPNYHKKPSYHTKKDDRVTSRGPLSAAVASHTGSVVV